MTNYMMIHHVLSLVSSPLWTCSWWMCMCVQ